jgi:RHS repeat-associated protein
LEEHVGSTGAVKKTYTIGLDVIAQQSPDVQTGNTLYLLADGHGSTRALIDAQLALVQKYLYDAYGNMLPGSGLTVEPANAFTSLLYSGEQTDITGLQYLRARYYNPASGRFNRLDPFAGNIQDPLSLHKYLYAHGDPIGLIDPSGEFGVLIVFSALFLVLVGYNYANAPGPGDPTFPNRDGVLEELPYEVAGLGVGHFVLRPVLGFVGRRVFAGSVHTVTGRLSAVFGDYWKIGGGISKEEAETVVKRFGFDLGPASKLQGSRFKNYKHSGGAVLISPADMRAGEIPRVLLAEEIQHGLDRATQEMTKAGYRGLTNEEFHREIFQRVLKNAESGVFDFLTDEDIQGIRKVIEAL